MRALQEPPVEVLAHGVGVAHPTAAPSIPPGLGGAETRAALVHVQQLAAGGQLGAGVWRHLPRAAAPHTPRQGVGQAGAAVGQGVQLCVAEPGSGIGVFQLTVVVAAVPVEVVSVVTLLRDFSDPIATLCADAWDCELAGLREQREGKGRGERQEVVEACAVCPYSSLSLYLSLSLS